MVQSVGQAGAHLPSSQTSVDWHSLVSFAVQATHLPASHTWWAGLQAAQSALVAQVMVGVPIPSVGQSSPTGTQAPKLEHSWPSGQESPPGPQATQRFSSTRQVVRPRCSRRTARRSRSCGGGTRRRSGRPAGPLRGLAVVVVVGGTAGAGAVLHVVGAGTRGDGKRRGGEEDGEGGDQARRRLHGGSLGGEVASGGIGGVERTLSVAVGVRGEAAGRPGIRSSRRFGWPRRRTGRPIRYRSRRSRWRRRHPRSSSSTGRGPRRRSTRHGRRTSRRRCSSCRASGAGAAGVAAGEAAPVLCLGHALRVPRVVAAVRVLAADRRSARGAALREGEALVALVVHAGAAAAAAGAAAAAAAAAVEAAVVARLADARSVPAVGRSSRDRCRRRSAAQEPQLGESGPPASHSSWSQARRRRRSSRRPPAPTPQA